MCILHYEFCIVLSYLCRMLRIACLCLLLPLFPVPQRPLKPKDPFSIKRSGSVDTALSEISGWIFVNDSTLIAHNDSGNEALLYVLNLDGTIRHTALINGIRNSDLEDIASDDKGNLYVGDIGNNANNRKNLMIHKIRINSVLSDSVVTSSPIFFSYAEQEAFPPANEQLYYDAEALVYDNDSLWIFTKCRTKPFDGKCLVYGFPAKQGTYKPTHRSFIETGKSTWLKDAVTAADLRNDTLYLLTYNRLLICDFNNRKPVLKTTVSMLPISQKEALAVNSKGVIYIADERVKLLGGGTIFTVTKNNKH